MFGARKDGYARRVFIHDWMNIYVDTYDQPIQFSDEFIPILHSTYANGMTVRLQRLKGRHVLLITQTCGV